MAPKPKVTLDFNALAKKTKDTGKKLTQPRGTAEYVPSPLAALVAESFKSETAREVPLPHPGLAGWEESEHPETGKVVKKYDPTVARDEYNAIVRTLRQDAAHQQLGLRVKEVWEYPDPDPKTPDVEPDPVLVAVEFQGRPPQKRGQSAEPDADE